MRLPLILLLCLWPVSSFAAGERPPHIVFILADDLGATDLAVYGADLHETPRLDRLAAEGLRFTSAYAAAPICSPTRASILTGKYPARLHMTIWREGALRPPDPSRKLLTPRTVPDLPHEEVTLAEALKQQGYVTAHIGKWHLGDAGYYPETQGFDYNIGGTLWGAPQTYFFPYSGTRYFGGEPRYVPHLEDGKPGEYLTDRLTSEAIRLLERHKDQSLFLYLAYHTVHTPIEGKPDLTAKFRARLKPGLHHRNPGYAAMVASLDENVGRLLDRIDELGVRDRTLVVFTSDNGGYINDFDGQAVTNNAPLRSGKGSLYEGGVRVPAIVRWPGHVQAGSISAEPVVTIDYYRTLLRAAGAPGNPRHNAGVDGEDLTPLFGNPSTQLSREAVYFHYPHYYPTTSPVSSVRARDWKLIHYYEDGRDELYHLSQDPSEARDLFSAEPSVAARLRGRLDQWLTRVRAQFPADNPALPQDPR